MAIEVQPTCQGQGALPALGTLAACTSCTPHSPWSARVSYTAAQVRNAIQSWWLALGAAGLDAEYGWVLINAAEAWTK